MCDRHDIGANPTLCDSGIYGYFTAGYVGHPQWNEMNFGFHPDRDVSHSFGLVLVLVLVPCSHLIDKTDIRYTSRSVDVFLVYGLNNFFR